MENTFCAHRGYSAKAPENTLAAFEAALRLGVDELELDLWPSKDGVLFVCHDRTVDRTTNGIGSIAELSSTEILTLDAGSWFAPSFAGERVPTFAQVLDLVSNQAILNIHIKSAVRMDSNSERMQTRRAEYNRLYQERARLLSLEGIRAETYPEVEIRQVLPYDEKVFANILREIDRHGARGHVYITGKKDVLMTAQKMAPDMPRCCLEGDSNYTIVEHAIDYDCARVQFCKHYLTQDMIDNAKATGIHRNLFWSDDAEEAAFYFALGINTILTNDPVRAMGESS